MVVGSCEADLAARRPRGRAPSELRQRSEARLRCDVSDVASFAQLLETVEKELGRIDVLVNCAGIPEPPGDRDRSAPLPAGDGDELLRGGGGDSRRASGNAPPGVRRRGERLVRFGPCPRAGRARLLRVQGCAERLHGEPGSLN